MLFSVASSELTGGAGICSSFVTDILADDGQKEPAIPDDLQHVKEINILNNDPPLDVSSEEAADFLATSPILLDPNSELSRLMKDLAVRNRCPEGVALLDGVARERGGSKFVLFFAQRA